MPALRDRAACWRLGDFAKRTAQDAGFVLARRCCLFCDVALPVPLNRGQVDLEAHDRSASSAMHSAVESTEKALIFHRA